MFYSQCLVSKNRPLGTIWVAAYFFKKLKKAQIKDTNIPSSIDQILQKELDALAYRVLAYLLLGVVRIYSKKVDFLFDDCNKVLIGVKEFVAKEKNKEKTTALLLPSSSRCFSIALPERFELDAFDLEILEDLHGSNVKPQEDITLKGGQETERLELYSMERFNMEDNLIENEAFTHDMDIDAEPLYLIESSRDHRNVCEHREEQELDDMLVDLQMSEEAAVRVIEAVLLSSHESPRDHQNGFEHKEDTAEHREKSESDKTLVEARWEKMRHAGSFLDECRSPETIHGIEEQPFGATRVDEEKEIPEMNTLEEPEPGSVSETKLLLLNTRDLLEKHRGNSDEERSDFEMFRESRRESSEGLHNGSEKVCLFDANLSEESSKRLNSKGTNTPQTPSQLRIPEDSAETSLPFSIIPTPAGKEVSRVSRKRKCLIDDEVVIPSKVMKKMIEDSSGLVTQRRKAPRTAYIEWRTKRFANPSQCFLDPLISYSSLELTLLSSQPIKIKEQDTPETSKPSNRIESVSLGTIRTRGSVLRAKQIADAQETMETPQATDPETAAEVSTEMESRLTASDIANQTDITPETPVKPADITPETPLRSSEPRYSAPETPLVSEQIEIAPETPVRESKSIRLFKDRETFDKETRPSSSFTSFDNQTSMFCDLDAVLMQEEVNNTHEGEDLQQDTWSTRTRNVAKFLEKTFQKQREKEEEEKVSLLELCRQRTRKESARLFYETLVLKTKGYLEVNQDYPYTDILLTKQQQPQQQP